MIQTKTIHEAMLADFKDESLFNQAQQYALDYLNKAFDRNIFPTEEALEGLSVFDEDIPKFPGNAKETISLLHTYGSPATVPMTGGRYFGFVNGSMVPAGLAAKNLSIYWDQNSAMQVLSPIASKLESVVQQWFIDLLGLPKKTVAGFVSGTSMANFCGLAAARYRVLKNQGWDVTKDGLIGAPQVRVVAGRHAHSTALKAVSLIGLGKNNIEWVDCDDQGRVLADRIPELDNTTILLLQAGNVNSGSFDPFNKICKKAQEQGAWVHIDGAFGLWAAATDKLKYLTTGYQHADSWAVDGHKTLNTPYDSGIILCSDEEAHVSALHMSGSYIIKDKDRDGMYYTPEMSRRARIVELWATLKYLGREGLNQMIYGMHERAVQFGKELSALDGFTVVNDVVFNQVLVQCDTDLLTDQTVTNIQEERVCWVGGAEWAEKRVIRISVCSWSTTSEDVTKSVASFRRSLARAKSI